MELKKFLSSRYSTDDFEDFIRERFYGLEIQDSSYTNDDLSDNEKLSISEYRYLGKSELDDGKEIGFFEFRSLTPNIENKRVGYNTILKKLAKEYIFDGAIASFYHPDGTVWRLSFVGFEYDEGRANVTNLRRYTYVLGEEVITKTAYMQLKKLKYPKLHELQEIFSIESVTKEFYKGIEKLYFELLEQYLIYPDNSDESRKEFVTRTIGRILFIKFLEKKDLIPNSIFKLKENYYFDVLEPLFFEQLSKPHHERFSMFLNPNIPFLNGGLFEPIESIDYYHFNKDIQSRQRSGVINDLKIEDLFFEKLYQHLNAFNFTIDENTLDDSELSIDPEMLGRIFENFLAEITPDTAENARKASGTYYTPREIVHYMVRQSILEHLKTHTRIDNDKLEAVVNQTEYLLEAFEKTQILTALYDLKILDPACGSGAFLMGMLQEINRVLQGIDKDGEIWFRLQDISFQNKNKNKNKSYFRKLSIINNSIYGVDIQPIAVEISKLRFFLSLVVDEIVDNTKENRGIEPLPNLEFKFVCANTLLPLSANEPTVLDEYFAYLTKLKKLKNKYFSAHGKDKEYIKNDYLVVQQELFDALLDIDIGEALGSNLTTYNPFNPLGVANFFDKEFIFNVDNGFNCIIGNPPYKRIQGIPKSISKQYKTLYKSATGSYDLYVIFVEQSLKLIAKGGIINFIMPDRWVNSAFGKGLRSVAHTKIFKLISFKDYQVFNASTYTSLIWLKSYTGVLKYLELEKDLKTNGELKRFLNQISDKQYSEIEYKTLDSKGWILTNKVSANILSKIQVNKLMLKDIFERIYTGLQTSHDDVYFLHHCKIISDELLSGFSKELNEKVIVERAFTKPILKGNEVHRYQNITTDRVVIFPYLIQKEKEKEKAILLSEKTIATSFPKGYDYLKKCETVLRGREKGKFDIDGEWYQFGRKQGMTEVTEEKIISPDISKGGNYAYDEFGKFYHTTTVYGYKKYTHIKESYKFYLALLNSKLLWWYLQQVGTPLANGFYRYMPRYIENFPVAKFAVEEVETFEVLVDYILYLKKTSSNIDEYVPNKHIVNQFQEVLDAMVFELYFREEFKTKDIEFIKYAQDFFQPIGHIDDIEKRNIIASSYQILSESKNKIRNNLILIDIEFKDIIIPIKRASNV